MPSFSFKGGMVTGDVKVLGKELIEAKLAKAEANILANNLRMVGEMLQYVKAEVEPQIPIGPGHFGIHLRDSFTTDLRVGKGQLGTKVIGVLKSAVQGYWREFGTMGRFRRSALRTKGRGSSRRLLESYGGEGEHAFMTAHKALAGIKRFINAYYGGLAKWWHV